MLFPNKLSTIFIVLLLILLLSSCSTSSPPIQIALDPNENDSFEPEKNCTEKSGSASWSSRSTKRPRGKKKLKTFSDEPKKKIVGGHNFTQDYPFMAALAYEKEDGTLSQFCGGTLIDERHVLTAAHCTIYDDDKVILGRKDLDSSEGKVYEIERFIDHCGYNDDNHDNDAKIIELEKRVKDIQPITLIGEDETFDDPGNFSTVIGWGLLAEEGEASKILQEVEVPIVSEDVCISSYPGDITENMLCAGQKAKDSCQGDSGGPLMVLDSTREWRQAGIVSWGIGCAREEFYGVYTKVSKMVPWINSNLE